MDWVALKRKLEQNRLRKISSKFPEHPTENQYSKDYTYKEHGEGKFPIREEAPKNVLEKDISDAERLMHNVSPEHQSEVKTRIDEIKEKHHLD